jgi:hypothetical protein
MTVASLSLLMFLAATTLSAQAIRGTVVDAATQEPIEDATVAMMDSKNATIGKPVRTNALGQFILYAPDEGDYRVNVTRIGYQPLAGQPLSIGDAELASMQLTMSAVATTVGSIEVTSRRGLSVGELMSTVGFDLRSARGQGHFIGRDELQKYGGAPLENVMRDNAVKLSIRFAEDPVFRNEVMVMQSGVSYCVPEVRLDGNPLPNTRGGVTSRLRTYGADQIYGVEVHRAAQFPPPRLAAELGTVTPNCGAVAIWTRSLQLQTNAILFSKK